MNDIIKDHENLIARLSTFPPCTLISSKKLTDAQKSQWEQAKFKWQYFGMQIDYLQRTKLGFILEPPLKSYRDLHPAHQVSIEIEADRLFAELNLMIEGWELIKNAAKENQRSFLFTNPRELFSEACKQEAEYMCRFFLSDGVNQGDSMTFTRNYYRATNAFYRDRLVAKTKDFQFWLEVHQECPFWTRFIIYAIWDHRHNKKFNCGGLNNAWRAFLSAYKAEVSLICDKNFFKKYRVKADGIKWNCGYPVSSSTSRPLYFP